MAGAGAYDAGGGASGDGGGSGGQGWQQRPPPPGASRGMAIAALVLGLVACALFWTVVGGFLLGLAALVLGIMAALRARKGRATGRTMAIAGAALGALAVLGAALILTLGLALWNSDTVKDFKECLRQAQTDDERHSCELKFGEEWKEDDGN